MATLHYNEITKSTSKATCFDGTWIPDSQIAKHDREAKVVEVKDWFAKNNPFINWVKETAPEATVSGYSITKDCIITFTEGVFQGGYRSGRRFVAGEAIGDRRIVAKVLKESYGAEKAQHTFTLEVIESTGVQAVAVGEKILRKGRNIYPNLVACELPSNHSELAEEKHERGAKAKSEAQARKKQ